MRKYVSLKILRSIYFAIFDSDLSYCCLVWAQNCSTVQRIIILQKKSIGIINSHPRNFHTSLQFKQNSILKFQDKMCLENILCISKSLNNLSPSVLIHFPQINITFKPQVLLRVISENFFIRQKDMENIQ